MLTVESLKTGDWIDGFEVGEILHSGGMATVFQARDVVSNQIVALKVPFGDILNRPIQYYHYQNEERISRYLSHPSIVRFYYTFRTRQYVVLEKIDGDDLRKRIGTNKRIPLLDACDLVYQIGDGLTHLHEQGIIHLDLKPENIMITGDNRIKIIDFGLANKEEFPDLMDEDFHTPHGTPYYISPEQILGFRREPKSDLYSLGVMFYEMLTSHLPYKRSKKLSQVRKRLKMEPVPPRYYNPEIPPQVQQIIMRTISRHPDERYESVAAMCAELREYQKLKIDEIGLAMKPPNRLHYLFASPVALSPGKRQKRWLPKKSHQILGCIIDDDLADKVLGQVKCHALLHDSDVTLIHVVDEDIDVEFRKYGVQVEGEKLRKRIERYIQKLRRYNIDPTIRIIPGGIKETILMVAENIRCDLLFVGPPRKKMGKVFMIGNLGKKVARLGGRLIICDVDEYTVEDEMRSMSFKEVNDHTLLALDLFFIDLWFEHLTWISEIAYQLLLDGHSDIDASVSCCVMGNWLDTIRQDRRWQQVSDILDKPHVQMHNSVEKLKKAAANGDINGMKTIYQEEYQGLSCMLLDGFREVSRLLHRKYKIDTSSASILGLSGCPLYTNEIPYGGPLLKLKQVGAYLDDRVEQGGEGS